MLRITRIVTTMILTRLTANFLRPLLAARTENQDNAPILLAFPEICQREFDGGQRVENDRRQVSRGRHLPGLPDRPLLKRNFKRGA